MSIEQSALVEDENGGVLSRKYLEFPTPKLVEHRKDVDTELDRRRNGKLERKKENEAKRVILERNFEDATAAVERWEHRLFLVRKGMTRDGTEDEIDEDFDWADEDGDEATAFWEACNEDMAKFRERFPLHAEMWFGEHPSEDAIAEAEAEHAEAETKLDEAVAAKQKFSDEFVESEVESDVDDYDVDPISCPDEQAAVKKALAAVAKKKERELANSKLTKTQLEEREKKTNERRENSATKRQLQKQMIEEHPELVHFKKVCTTPNRTTH